MNWFRKFVAATVAAVSLGSVAPAQAEELNLFAWSEYIPQTVLDAFKKETGITVNYEAFASNEEMVAKLLAGASKYDLIQPSEYIVEALTKAKKLTELDHAKLPNLKNLDPKMMKLAYDPGLKYSVPYMTGAVGIAYNKEKIKEPIKGFKDIFSGKHAGRIVVVDDAREILSWVLATQGKDINTINKEVIDGARPMMGEWLKQVKLYDSDSPKDALMNGDVDIGIVWSGEGATLLNEQPDKFAWVLPAEGTHMFIDNLSIPADAKNKEAAYKFINFILRPEISKMISDDFPYTNPNLEARKLLDEDAKKNAASYPPADVKLDIFRDIGEVSSLIDELYTSLKSK
jgi:spermidine/putrescine transport system substrate-binding protein